MPSHGAASSPAISFNEETICAKHEAPGMKCQATNVHSTTPTSDSMKRQANVRSATPTSESMKRTMTNVRSSTATPTSESSLMRRLRRMPPKPPSNPNLEWVPLVDGIDTNINEMSFDEITRMDRRRKELLSLARSTSAIDTLGQLRTLPRTVLPRLFRRPILWAIILLFVASAVLARCGLITDSMLDEAGGMDHGGDTTVTFMVVFYVGYCYTRCNEQFNDVQSIMHDITDACLTARVTFADELEVHRLWRYLNLLQASAYCGLTSYLSQTNFLMPLIEKYALLGSGAVKDEELRALHAIQIDENGARACSMYEVWAFEASSHSHSHSQSHSHSHPHAHSHSY